MSLITFAVFMAAATCCIGISIYHTFHRPVDGSGERTDLLWMGLGNLVAGIGIALYAPNPGLGMFNAAAGAWALVEWWNSGGGSGLRKKIKKWVKRLVPTLRLAPQGA